jgi:hypothetical protein
MTDSFDRSSNYSGIVALATVGKRQFSGDAMETQINPVVQNTPGKRRDRKILLVSRNPQRSSYFVDLLRARGWKYELATSYQAACSLLNTQDFCVVLSPTRLGNESFLPLMTLLEGSDVTLFYAEPVERGCWWLPALRRGVKCFGSRAVRPSKFISTLIDTIDGWDPLIGAVPEVIPRPALDKADGIGQTVCQTLMKG